MKKILLIAIILCSSLLLYACPEPEENESDKKTHTEQHKPKHSGENTDKKYRMPTGKHMHPKNKNRDSVHLKSLLEIKNRMRLREGLE